MSLFYWTNISSSYHVITKDPPTEDHIFPTVIIALSYLIINCLSKCDGSCLHQNFVNWVFRKISWDFCVYWSLIVQVQIVYHIRQYFIHYRTVWYRGKKLSTNLMIIVWLISIYLIKLLYYWFRILYQFII